MRDLGDITLFIIFSVLVFVVPPEEVLIGPTVLYLLRVVIVSVSTYLIYDILKERQSKGLFPFNKNSIR